MRALRAGVVGLVGVLLVVGLVVAGPRTARAAEPRAYVEIAFTAMSPSLPQRDGKVTLTGTVTNVSKTALSNLQAIFWRSLDPIQDAEGMQAALVSPANEPLGAREPDVFQYIPSKNDPTLAPKESATFSLTASVSDLVKPIDGVYLLGVHVRGQLVPGGQYITLGRGRVFAPIVETPPENSAQLSTLVILESRPSLIRKGVFADDHLAREIGPNGRLTALLDAAGTQQTSFAVDPALIEELQTMRSGYTIRRSDGSTRPGTGQGAAARWLAGYTRMAQRHTGFRLLYAHPDATALVHAGMSSVIEGGEEAAKAITTTSALPLLAAPAAGQADQATIEALAALKPRAILLDDSSTVQSQPLLQGPNGIPLLNTAARAFGGGPGPDPRNTPVQIRQHALAESWLEASTAGPDDTIGQLRVVRTKAEAGSNTGEVDAPWLRREPLDRLLASPAARWSGRYRYPDSAPKKELSSAQLGGVAQLVESYQTLGDLLVRPDDIDLEANAAAARSASNSWRNRFAAWQQFVDPQTDALTDLRRGAVKIVATPKVVTSAHSVFFPVTVRNMLPPSTDDPQRNVIRVRLQFTSANGQRLMVTPSQDMQNMQIPPGAGVTSNAQVDAKSNGTVRVVVRAYTLSGTPVGTAFPIDVQATQAGTIGWFIAIAAGLVLVGGSALRIRQVAKERARTTTDDSPERGVDQPHPAQIVPSPNGADMPRPDRDGEHPRNPESLDV